LPPAAAQNVSDRIRTSRGLEVGEVTQVTREEVTLNKRPSGSVRVAVNEIRSISFDGEPGELAQARVKAANGGFAEAAEALAKIDARTLRRDLVKQEVEYYQAHCAAMLALGGRGPINEAGTLLNNFVRAYPQNLHYWQAVELMGDLLAADGKFEIAQRQYNEFAKAPWPEYKMRAGVAIGRGWQAQGQHANAIKQFDIVLETAGNGSDAQNQKLAATLGKAISMAETGELNAAVGMIEQVIQNADPEQKELHARAYLALGSCYQRAGQTKDALLAYLHVDVLYNSVPEAHAEALAHLVTLFRAIGQEAQARESKQVLEQRYRGSRWAK
jgi:tetratricopeptide (TPR) repeat protein